MKVVLAAAAVVLLVLVPVIAVAQPDADTVAAEAERLAGEGRFPEAAAKFREAFAIDARSDLLCNVGVAYYKASDWPRAQFYLGQCLTQAGSLDAEFAGQVRTVLGAVDDQLRAGKFAPVRITLRPDTASFTISAFGDERVIGSQLIWLPFGTHEIAVSAEGHLDGTDTVVIGDKTEVTRTITLDRAPAGTIGTREVTVRPSKAPAVIATIATGVVGGAAVGVYLLARSKATAAGRVDDTTTYNRLVDAAKLRQKISWVLGGVAVVGAGVTGYLWYRATRSETRLEIAPTDGGAAVTFTTPF